MKQYFIILLYDRSRRILKPLLAPASWGHDDALSSIQRPPPTTGRGGKEASLEFFSVVFSKTFLKTKNYRSLCLKDHGKEAVP